MSRDQEERRIRSPARTFVLWTIMLLIMVGIAEAASAALYFGYVLPHFRYAIWDPASADIDKAWNSSADAPDEELGWPSPSRIGKPPYDRTGAKENADFVAASESCATAYGDSFVWGYGVPAEKGWVEEVSRQLGCRISNYAVPGYGIDQAFIRFRRNANDTAPVVLLGIYPQDVMRDVNQYRAFIGFPIDPGLVKGRFVLTEAGALEWIPRPSLNRERFVELNRRPSRIVPHDYLLPGSDDGPVTRDLSFTWTLLKFEFARLRGHPLPINAFLTPGDPSGAFELSIALVDAFRDLASQRRQKLLVVMLPGSSSLRQKRKSGTFEYDALRDKIQSQGIDVLDLGPLLLAKRQGQGFCDLFIERNACDGHYSEIGNRVVAEIMASELKRRSLLASGSKLKQP